MLHAAMGVKKVMKPHLLWGWTQAKTQGQDTATAAGQCWQGLRRVAQQMLGWATVPGSQHIAGHSPWVAEPETVADGHGFLPLPPHCTQVAFSPGDAQSRGIRVSAEAGWYCAAVLLRHQEAEQKLT